MNHEIFPYLVLAVVITGSIIRKRMKSRREFTLQENKAAVQEYEHRTRK